MEGELVDVVKLPVSALSDHDSSAFEEVLKDINAENKAARTVGKRSVPKVKSPKKKRVKKSFKDLSGDLPKEKTSPSKKAKDTKKDALKDMDLIEQDLDFLQDSKKVAGVKASEKEELLGVEELEPKPKESQTTLDSILDSASQVMPFEGGTVYRFRGPSYLKLHILIKRLETLSGRRVRYTSKKAVRIRRILGLLSIGTSDLKAHNWDFGGVKVRELVGFSKSVKQPLEVFELDMPGVCGIESYVVVKRF